MSKLVQLKKDGSIKIQKDEELLDIFKNRVIFTNVVFSTFLVLFFLFIDYVGFSQIVRLTVKDSELNRLMIVLGLTAAFDIAPLYIGYAICLKCYKLGRNIHTWVLTFSTSACLLGIIVNIVFRVLTKNIAYTQGPNSLAIPMTILMCIMPIITSLINLTVGCLSFDPLLFDIARLTKEIRILKVRKRRLQGCLQEVLDDNITKDIFIQMEDQRYNNTINDLEQLRTRLRLYVLTKL
ncbi:MAG: hypothetical protein IJ062_11955 [Firmicutes bacterium]|nr:hypothetical protein [Bacillota bacterium]